jgi:hypothetical protein
MKNLSFFLLAISMITLGCSRPGTHDTPKGDTINVEGVISKKDWSKSAESYCAQGSDYYVIEIKDSGEEGIKERYVIDMEYFPKSLDIADYVGETVDCRGEIVEKSWEINYDDGGQHPVAPTRITLDGEEVVEENPTNSCQVFRVLEIEVK